MEKLSIKVVGIIGLCLLFWVGLLAVWGVVRERAQYADEVIAGISREYVGEQKILAPFVAVPLERVVCPAAAATAKAESSAEPPPNASCPRSAGYWVLTPQQSDWQQQWQVDDQRFKRGIYAAKSYQGRVTIAGRLRADVPDLPKGVAINWAEARWMMAVADRRGLTAMPQLQQGGHKHAFELQELAGGSEIRWLSAPAELEPGQESKFDIAFDLAGTQALSMIPLGEDSRINLEANWPHPSFFGGNLPQERSMDQTSTRAEWHSPAAAQDNAALLRHCMLQLESGTSCQVDWQNGWTDMGLRFVDTTDTYSLTERSLKYGMLFIVFTFGTFFLYEVLRDLRVHPVQYLLVGAALTVFYLLLLSFGEQIGFACAYLGAATACIGLIVWYLQHVFASRRHALGCGGMLVVLYAGLYGLLHTDENTLIIGSVLLFALIALAMFLTRHVDWYAVGKAKKAQHDVTDGR